MYIWSWKASNYVGYVGESIEHFRIIRLCEKKIISEVLVVGYNFIRS